MHSSIYLYLLKIIYCSEVRLYTIFLFFLKLYLNIEVQIIIYSLQVLDDGKLPRHICQSCNQSVKDISVFFDVLTAGQRRLRELWKEQV